MPTAGVRWSTARTCRTFETVAADGVYASVRAASEKTRSFPFVGGFGAEVANPYRLARTQSLALG